MTDHILCDISNRVMTITLNRPERKNALTRDMYGAIADALAEADANKDIRAIVITGTGDAFTSGNDIGDFTQKPPEGKQPVTRFLENISTAQTPILAAVNGIAVGVGLTMLLHCDLVFASKDARFKAPFTSLGLVPEAASSLLLPNAVGMAWANDILIAGRLLSADDALSAGLASRIYAPDELLEETQKVAATIAALAPSGVLQTKALIRANRKAVSEKMQIEGEIFAAQLQSAEFKEAAMAFMQGRPAVFD
ncbi:MAG: enoyl-CoA hydratase/carnithine racemase [Halocynthiibacter sp.]|jgi:enoyl-CoA hydratase/carnithine racemase